MLNGVAFITEAAIPSLLLKAALLVIVLCEFLVELCSRFSQREENALVHLYYLHELLLPFLLALLCYWPLTALLVKVGDSFVRLNDHQVSAISLVKGPLHKHVVFESTQSRRHAR
jgi:hypothetical protein